jgi:PTS system N-acetylglucosamine-specific IIC component
VLYAIHAVLTGVSMALMNALGVKLGFGFSAGLFDYVLNYGKATKPLLLIPVGLAYAAIYYVLFRTVIKRLDLPTPGRERDAPVAAATIAKSERGAAFAEALGGAANLTSVGACTTRLRLIVVDQGAVDEARLKALGARGLIRPSDKALQIVLGPIADSVAVEIRDAIAAGGVAPSATVPAPEIADIRLTAATLTALGGADNVETATQHGTRLRIRLKDADRASAPALEALGVHAIARPAPGLVHLLMATDTNLVAQG